MPLFNFVYIYDGAEVCKFVDTFLLEKISEICNEGDIGL